MTSKQKQQLLEDEDVKYWFRKCLKNYGDRLYLSVERTPGSNPRY